MATEAALADPKRLPAPAHLQADMCIDFVR
jgi:hypothetical protein